MRAWTTTVRRWVKIARVRVWSAMHPDPETRRERHERAVQRARLEERGGSDSRADFIREMNR